MKKMLALSLLAMALPLPAAVIYGYRSQPAPTFTFSSTPIPPTVVFNPGPGRIDTVRIEDSIGIRQEVTNAVTGSNRVEALRYEIVSVAGVGPMLPSWMLVIDWAMTGTYSLGFQSIGYAQVTAGSGGAPNLGGVYGGSGHTYFTRLGGDLPSTGTFFLASSTSVAVPVGGSIGLWFIVEVQAQNNGYVEAMNSLHFGNARLIDTTTGLPVPGAIITSESGFDWTTPLPSSVPEPATGALSALAVGLLLSRVRAHNG